MWSLWSYKEIIIRCILVSVSKITLYARVKLTQELALISIGPGFESPGWSLCVLHVSVTLYVMLKEPPAA